jgi:transposase
LTSKPGRRAATSSASLKELHIAREALVKDRTAKNRAKIRTLALLKRQNAQRLDQFERQIAAIDAAILAFIEADAELAKRFAILMSIPRTSNGFLLPLRAKSAGVMCSPGVWRITAVALLIEMPELGTLEAAQAASLAGLAPVARQSGRWTGRAFIRGGRASVRKALSMPALVAARFNPDMKAKYAQRVAAGKAAKVALTALMRKLIVLANALLATGRSWQPKRA